MKQNAIKRKFIWNHYRIAFDGSFSWSRGNGFPQNIGIFGAANSSLRKLKMFITTFKYLVHIDNIDNIDDS